MGNEIRTTQSLRYLTQTARHHHDALFLFIPADIPSSKYKFHKDIIPQCLSADSLKTVKPTFFLNPSNSRGLKPDDINFPHILQHVLLHTDKTIKPRWCTPSVDI